MKMLQYLLILCVQMMSISMAPLQVQYQTQLSLQPTQEELLQQQLLALQQLQNLQMMNEWNNYYQPSIMQNQAPPMMILLPESQISSWAQINNELNHQNFLTKSSDVKNKETDNDDSDSIVVDAEPSEPTPEPMKALLLIPNTRRFSIGGIISAIPFLPIEINVPDTISWIYGGISSIISGIGNRFPIKRPVQKPVTTSTEGDSNVRLLLTKLQNRSPNKKTPILMLPDVAQMYPMAIPMGF